MEERTLKESAMSGLIWKFSERVGAQLVSLIVSIILARILLPEDYSVVSIVTIFFSFCNIFVTGGLSTALIQKKDTDEEDYATIFWTNLLIALVLYFIMYAFAPVIANLYDNDILVSIIRVMGLSFFINGIKSVLSAYISSTLQFKKFFFSTIIGTLISAVIGILMAKNGFGAWALVAQQMSNAIIDTCVLFFTTKFRVLFKFSIEKLKILFAFGGNVFVASFISVLYDQISPMIIGVKFTTNDLAFYSKGRSFPLLLNDTISSSLSAVVFPVISKVQDNKQAVLTFTRRNIGLTSYIVFPVMMGFFAVADEFVKLVLTDKWLPAVPYVQIFCLSYMFNIIQTGNLEAIKAIGRSDLILKLEVIKKSLYFLVIFLFVMLTDSPQTLALSSIVCTIIATVVNTYPNRKLIGYAYRKQAIDILPNICIAALMGVIVHFVGKIDLPVIMLLLLQIIVGVISYVLLSIVTKNDNFIYLLKNIKAFINKSIDRK